MARTFHTRSVMGLSPAPLSQSRRRRMKTGVLPSVLAMTGSLMIFSGGAFLGETGRDPSAAGRRTMIKTPGREEEPSLVTLPLHRGVRNLGGALTIMDEVLSGVSGGGGVLHFVHLYVGSPATRRTLAVSTSSDFTAFPCGDCKNCGASLKPFDAQSSSTFSTIACGKCVADVPDDEGEELCSHDGARCLASYQHVDQSSWRGYEARDMAYIGPALDKDSNTILGTDVTAKEGFPLVFACQVSALGRFSTQVQDGILGFGRGKLGIVNQMFKAGMLDQPVFSLCFDQSIDENDLNVQTNVGALTLGGYHPLTPRMPVTYAQITPGDDTDRTAYRLYVTGIYVREGGGQSVLPDRGVDQVRLRKVEMDTSVFNLGSLGMSVDAGASHTTLHSSVEESFRQIWARSTGGKEFTFGKQHLTQEELKNLPTIMLQFMSFDGVDKSLNPNSIPNMAGDLDPSNPFDALLAIPPEHYMERSPGTDTYRVRLSFDTRGPVLGADAMRGKIVVYDSVKMCVGFAEVLGCRPEEDMTQQLEEVAGRDGSNVGKGVTFDDDDLFVLPQDEIITETGSPPAIMRGSETPAKDQSTSSPLSNNAQTNFGVQVTEPTYKIKGTGTCSSVTCRMWMSVGYFMLGCMLAIAYRAAQKHDLSLSNVEDSYITDGQDGRGEDDESEIFLGGGPTVEKELYPIEEVSTYIEDENTYLSSSVQKA